MFHIVLLLKTNKTIVLSFLFWH